MKFLFFPLDRVWDLKIHLLLKELDFERSIFFFFFPIFFLTEKDMFFHLLRLQKQWNMLYWKCTFHFFPFLKIHFWAFSKCKNSHTREELFERAVRKAKVTVSIFKSFACSMTHLSDWNTQLMLTSEGLFAVCLSSICFVSKLWTHWGFYHYAIWIVAVLWFLCENSSECRELPSWTSEPFRLLSFW